MRSSLLSPIGPRWTRALAFAWIVAAPLSAQIPEGMEGEPFVPHEVAGVAIGRLYSPFCPGQMLGTCPSPNAMALRDSIQAMAYQGSSADEIVEWVLARHGRQYLATPPGSGLGLWAWLLPPFAIVGGAVAVSLFLRRQAPAAARPAAKGSPSRDRPGGDRPVTDDEEARLKAAIREIELSEDPSF